MALLARPVADGVCLVKPQFEAGRDKVGKKGVVRDPAIHEEVIHTAMETAHEQGFSVLGLDYSPVKGPEGNIEFLLHLKKSPQNDILSKEQVAQVVSAAHNSL